MGRSIFNIGVVALAAALTACGDRGVQRAPTGFSAEPAEVRFDPTALGDTREATVTLRNRGRASFRVEGASTAVVGISVAGFEGFVLGAGEERALLLRFSPQLEGEVSGALEIVTDSETAGEKGVATVPLSGLGVEAIVTVAQDRIDFGDVEIGAVKMAELEVENRSQAEAPFRLYLQGTDAPMFSSTELDKRLTLEPGEKRRIPLAFSPYRLAAAQVFLQVEPCVGCAPRQVELVGFGISSVVDVRPLRIDFGRVAPGARASQTLTITNLGSETLSFTGFAWQGNAGVYQLDHPPVVPLEAGKTFVATVTFQPTAVVNIPTALLEVKVQAKNATGIKVPVMGEVGESCVVPIPKKLDFGLVPQGMSSQKRVDLLNRCGQQVQIGELAATVDSGGYFGLANGGAPIGLKPGEIASVPVTFTPKVGTTDSTGRLTFKAFAGASVAYTEVPLTGTSKVFAPCQYSVVPPALDFGLVPVGGEVTLGVAIRNDGTDDCFVSDWLLASGSDAAFSATPTGSLLLRPGEKAVLPVQLKPTAVGTFVGMAEGFVNHPSNGRVMALLSGRGVQGCFQLQPTSVDFGIARISCGVRTRSVVAVNGCTAPVTLGSAALDAATSGEISLQAGPALPFVLNPGAQAMFTLAYQPVDDGVDIAALRVEAGQGGLNTVGVRGQGQTKDTQTDRFLQEVQAKVDVLLVIDNSGSMMEEQTNLAANFAALLSGAQAAGIDYQIGITTTGLDPSPGGWSSCPGGVEGGEAGRLFPVNNSTPRIITPNTPNAAQVFANNVKVGWCHWNEQGLEAAYRALSEPLVSSTDDPRTPQPDDGNAGFLRPDARLVIIVVSDEEDFSTQPVDFYVTFFRAVKKNDPSLLSFSAIVAPPSLGLCPTASSSGSRYAAVAAQTGGITENICTQNWASSLQTLSSNAFGPKRRFQLRQTPSDTTKIEVEVDGVKVTSGWSYDSATNSVVFEPSTTPPPGAAIDVTYPLGC
ncbi:MAG: choice-of-anchor D domain-containing protein [Myxococcota bacterium]